MKRWAGGTLYLPLNFVCVLRGCAAGGVTVRPLKKEQGEDEKVALFTFRYIFCVCLEGVLRVG